MAFLSRHLVRFADIDRAGIVYYPRFFDFFHRSFEDFFADEVGTPYHRMIDERRVGFPIVHVDSDFKIPLQHGDLITIEVTTAKIGNRSLAMRYRAFRPAMTTPAAVATITQACLHMGTFATMPIPDDVRAALARHAELETP
jgi:4-hydroxybenzoyl-CoA thioesterase